MAQEQDHRHAGEMDVEPLEEHVRADVFDEPAARDEPMVVVVDPTIAYPTFDDRARRRDEGRVVVSGPEILAVAEAVDFGHVTRRERFEHEPIFVRVIDELRDPRRAAAAAAGEECRRAMIAAGIEMDLMERADDAALETSGATFESRDQDRRLVFSRAGRLERPAKPTRPAAQRICRDITVRVTRITASLSDYL